MPRHECDVCGRDYSRPDSVIRHANNKDHPQNDTTECPSCDRHVRCIGSHFSQSPSCRPELTKYQHEVITGALMGDGCINEQEQCYPRFLMAVVTEPYIQWLNDDVFPVLGTVRQPNIGPNNVQQTYELTVRSHPTFEEYRAWYDSGEKVFPDTIDLTPTVLKHWYVTDGHLYDYYDRTPYAEIATANEMDNKEKIESYFDATPIEVDTWSRHNLRFRADQTDTFFEYIGDPLPGFEYKWPANSR